MKLKYRLLVELFRNLLAHISFGNHDDPLIDVFIMVIEFILVVKDFEPREDGVVLGLTLHCY
jgi:hypothetical protein